MNYIEKLKNETKNADDFVYKNIVIGSNKVDLINIESITSADDINNFILKRISFLDKLNTNDLTDYLYNYLPITSISYVIDYQTLKDKLLNGFTILIINDKDILAVETRRDLTRGVSEADYEKTIVGPKDAFIEHYNTNLGLIRRRIKDENLHIKTYSLGKYTKTKVGLIYLNGICKDELVNSIDKKLKKINIDCIIDSNYLKRYLNNSKSLFPTLKSTERPDLASLSLLEGKVLLIVDNSPEVLILPTFFIDFFHTSDDYYQKQLNISFIRIIRLIAFIISIFLPAFYIALTTHNPDSMPINLLLSFQSQRLSVPFPAFVEAILMIIIFEILRESDIRIPSSMGTAISILGGLVLGDAAVSAGIVSPIMIIVVAISAISGLLMQSIEAINSIRWYRFILIILTSIWGYYGIFLGIILILTNLSDTKSQDKDYLYPFAPINFSEQKDGFIRINEKKYKFRNPILSNNKIRGK
ncbi:MAG: spore germination protein [Bacilli bacterium]|nr:spore germination protein [Bacilli bacterium]